MRLSVRALGTCMAVVLAVGVAIAHSDRPQSALAAAGLPSRVLDTRIGLGARAGKVSPGETLRLPLRSSVDASATSVLLNITATDADAPGWVRAWPCESPEPATSVVNFVPQHVADANAVLVGLGGGDVCLSTYAAVHLVADLTGSFSGSADFVPTTPQRIVDTRSSGDPLRAGQERRVRVGGSPGVPAGAAIVELNITVVEAPEDGWIVAYPCGSPTSSSTLTFRAGEVVATSTFARLVNGDVCLRSWGTANFVLDVYGWSTGGGVLQVGAPQRLLDTRDGASWPTGQVQPGQTVALPVAGRGGVPGQARSVMLIMTAVDVAGPGYLTVWPCGQPYPGTSALNTWSGQLRSNLVFVNVAADGTVCLRSYSSNSTGLDVVVDVVGWALPPNTTSNQPTTTPTVGPGGAPATPTVPVTSVAGATNCGLAVAAFCASSFGSPVGGGRSGDLDPRVWSVGRVVGEVREVSDLLPFPDVAVPACRAGVSSVGVERDVLVCDGSSGHGGQLLTALAAQNYSVLSLSPRQPFDFAGRSGSVVYDVDAETKGSGAWWTSLFISDLPVPVASSASQVLGYMPRNGLGLTFDDPCGGSGRVGVGSLTTYVNSVETVLTNSDPVCVSTSRGVVNHFKVVVSQTQVTVLASDAGSNTLKTVFTANVNLSFTRGYVHFQTAERAPVKYAFAPGYTTNYWANMGFDGPVLPVPAVSQVPDSLSPSALGTNVGYPVAAGRGSTVTIADVPASPSSATLTFTANLQASSNPTLSYSINGGPTHLAQADIAAQQVCHNCPGPQGGFGVAFAYPIDTGELRPGNNTITFTGSGQNGSWPFILGNIDLLTT